MPTTAKEIMTTELILGSPEMTVQDALKKLINNRITGMPIVDKENKLIGILSEYDIIKNIDALDSTKPIDLDKNIKFSQKTVTINEDTHITEIFRKFSELKLRRLPVLNHKQQLVGIITRRDIMRVLFYQSKAA